MRDVQSIYLSLSQEIVLCPYGLKVARLVFSLTPPISQCMSFFALFRSLPCPIGLRPIRKYRFYNSSLCPVLDPISCLTAYKHRKHNWPLELVASDFRFHKSLLSNIRPKYFASVGNSLCSKWRRLVPCGEKKTFSL